MNRIIKIPNVYGTENKYVLRDEYNGFGFYQEKCPTGYFINQSYLISKLYANRITIYANKNYWMRLITI